MFKAIANVVQNFFYLVNDSYNFQAGDEEVEEVEKPEEKREEEIENNSATKEELAPSDQPPSYSSLLMSWDTKKVFYRYLTFLALVFPTLAVPYLRMGYEKDKDNEGGAMPIAHDDGDNAGSFSSSLVDGAAFGDNTYKFEDYGAVSFDSLDEGLDGKENIVVTNKEVQLVGPIIGPLENKFHEDDLLKKESKAQPSYDLQRQTFSSRRSNNVLPKYCAGGNTTLVNSNIVGAQRQASVSSLNDGKIVIVWLSYTNTSYYEVRGKIYTSTEKKYGEEFIVSAGGLLDHPKVLRVAVGFMVTWEGMYGGYYENRAKILGFDGGVLVNEFVISKGLLCRAVNLANGNIAICYSSSDYVACAIYSTTGQVIGKEFHLSGKFSQGVSAISVRALPCGNRIVAAWTGYLPDSADIYAGIYDYSMGQKIGGDFKVNTYTADYQLRPSVAVSLFSGDIFIFWQSQGQDGSDWGVYGSRFNSSGSKISDDFLVNTNTDGYQGWLDATITADDHVVVAWEEYSNNGGSYIYSRVYAPNAKSSGFPCLVDSSSFSQYSVSISDVTNKAGSYLLAWDGAGAYYADIYLREVHIGKQPPTLVNNTLIVTEGKASVLTNSMLGATDVDSNPTEVIFFTRNIKNGMFTNSNNRGVAINSFSQQDILDGKILFIHDGSEFAPSYEVKVSNGDWETAYTLANITFIRNVNNVPVLVSNNLVVNEGQALVLTSAMLKATDVEIDSAQLNFTVINPQHGQFEFISAPGTVITSFLQQNITAGQVRFVPDGSSFPPAYNVSVSDGQVATIPMPANVTFNRAPVLINNTLTIIEGEQVNVTRNELDARDEDGNNDALTFRVSSSTLSLHGFFQKNGVTVSEFNIEDVVNDTVKFIPDRNNPGCPAYNITVIDSEGALTKGSPANVTCIPKKKDVPEPGAPVFLPWVIGGVAGVGLLLLAVGGGVVGAISVGAIPVVACLLQKKKKRDQQRCLQLNLELVETPIPKKDSGTAGGGADQSASDVVMSEMMEGEGEQEQSKTLLRQQP